jgi:hypothetical protein
MFLKLPVKGFLFFLVFVLASRVMAQPMLPDIAVSKDKGINIISWNCQYDGIKSIAVQRSSDSIYNYKTIGLVGSLKKGVQAYIDGHPNPGKNFYRLYIVFNSQLTWYSNRARMKVDSSELLNKRVLPPNDSLQKFVSTLVFQTDASNVTKGKVDGLSINQPTTTGNTNKSGNDTTLLSPDLSGSTVNMNTSTSSSEAPTTPAEVAPPPPPKIVLNIPESAEDESFSFVQSQYVFTDPFNGHINIALPDCKQHYYTLIFKNGDGKKIMVIEKITEPKVILDKRNFNRKGIYDFELKKDHKNFENGKISIF